MAQPFPEVVEIVSPGLGASLQDLGRPGWKRFGVPDGGAMDDHAFLFANRLIDNPSSAPVLELLMQGAHLRFLRDSWIALTGADSQPGVPMWQAVRMRAYDEIQFPRNLSGVWTYLAIEHGFLDHDPAHACPSRLAGWLGRPLQARTRLVRADAAPFEWPSHVASRLASPSEIRDYRHPPLFKVWPGPQWNDFSEEHRALLCQSEWTVTSQSNRVGYRLAGPALSCRLAPILSEPVLAGTIQVPDDGQPIVTMRDGPTVGGYPKIAWIDPRDLSWVAQGRPGQTLRWELVT